MKSNSTLALKYRPQSLKDFIGNDDTVKSLDSVLSRKTPPQSYLLTGPSGCGKTTLARIIKNRLGCSDHDYVEMDCGDERGIDNIRNLRRQMRLSPMSGNCRVWLLDEGHMIGKGGASPKNEAQNALLKALEEPPKHVYLILATTNPEMLLKTIRNRCSTFSVDEISKTVLTKYLRKVCHWEEKKVPQEVLRQISQDSMGSPRSALTILDRIIDLPQEKMKLAAEQQAEKENEMIDLCRALLKQTTWKKISVILKGLNQEPETIRRMILAYMTSVLLNTGGQKPARIIDCFLDNFYDSGKAGLVLACYESLQKD